MLNQPRKLLALAASACAVVFLASPAMTQDDSDDRNDTLVIGGVNDGVTHSNNHATYRFTVEEAGLLTVAVRAKHGDDMTIDIIAPNGRQIGHCDIDYNGDVGSEHLAVPLVEPGVYRVVVNPLGQGGAFWIGASWLPIEGLAELAPPRPENPADLAPGEAQTATVGGESPSSTWYKFTAESDGILIVRTTAESGNLVLEAFQNEDFENIFARSDQNRQGNNANEHINFNASQGQTYYFKVRSRRNNDAIEFTLNSQFIPLDDE